MLDNHQPHCNSHLTSHDTNHVNNSTETTNSTVSVSVKSSDPTSTPRRPPRKSEYTSQPNQNVHQVPNNIENRFDPTQQYSKKLDGSNRCEYFCLQNNNNRQHHGSSSKVQHCHKQFNHSNNYRRRYNNRQSHNIRQFKSNVDNNESSNQHLDNRVSQTNRNGKRNEDCETSIKIDEIQSVEISIESSRTQNFGIVSNLTLNNSRENSDWQLSQPFDHALENPNSTLSLIQLPLENRNTTSTNSAASMFLSDVNDTASGNPQILVVPSLALIEEGDSNINQNKGVGTDGVEVCSSYTESTSELISRSEHCMKECERRIDLCINDADKDIHGSLMLDSKDDKSSELLIDYLQLNDVVHEQIVERGVDDGKEANDFDNCVENIKGNENGSIHDLKKKQMKTEEIHNSFELNSKSLKKNGDRNFYTFLSDEVVEHVSGKEASEIPLDIEHNVLVDRRIDSNLVKRNSMERNTYDDSHNMEIEAPTKLFDKKTKMDSMNCFTSDLMNLGSFNRANVSIDNVFETRTKPVSNGLNIWSNQFIQRIGEF